MDLKVYLSRGLSAAILGVTLTACGLPAVVSQPGASLPATSQPTTTAPNVQPTVVAAIPSPTPVPVQARPVPASAPVIGFEPQAGVPGTLVTVWGTGYIPNAPVVVRLGFPRPTGEVLFSAFANKDGRWNGSLTIPDRLPSGELIPDGEFRLVAMNEQNKALASAPFAFVAASPALSHAQASQTVRDMLGAWANGDIKPYLTAELRAKLAGHETTDELLGLHILRLQSFDVQLPQDRPSEVLFVPAMLVYEEFTEERIYELVIRDNQWRVSGSTLVKTVANQPQPTDQRIAWEGLRIRVPEGYTTDTKIHGAGAINGVAIQAHLGLIPSMGATPGETAVEQPSALIFDTVPFSGGPQAWFDSLYPPGTQITAYSSALNELPALAYRPGGADSPRLALIMPMGTDKLLLVESDTRVPVHQQVLDTIVFTGD